MRTSREDSSTFSMSMFLRASRVFLFRPPPFITAFWGPNFDKDDSFHENGAVITMEPSVQCAPALRRSCCGCRKEFEHVRRCKRCLAALYCSSQCQRLDWPLHKTLCNEFETIRDAPHPALRRVLAFEWGIDPAGALRKKCEQLNSVRPDYIECFNKLLINNKMVAEYLAMASLCFDPDDDLFDFSEKPGPAVEMLIVPSSKSRAMKPVVRTLTCKGYQGIELLLREHAHMASSMHVDEFLHYLPYPGCSIEWTGYAFDMAFGEYLNPAMNVDVAGPVALSFRFVDYKREEMGEDCVKIATLAAPVQAIRFEGMLFLEREVRLFEMVRGVNVIHMENVQDVVSVKSVCGNCVKRRSETTKLRSCGICRNCYYCSKKCQKEHWETHKLKCNTLVSNLAAC